MTTKADIIEDLESTLLSNGSFKTLGNFKILKKDPSLYIQFMPNLSHDTDQGRLTKRLIEATRGNTNAGLHYEFHLGNNKHVKSDERKITLSFQIEANRNLSSKVIYSDLISYFGHKVLTDFKRSFPFIRTFNGTPDTFDNNNLYNHGNKFHSYWIGFEFCNLKNYFDIGEEKFYPLFAFPRCAEKNIEILDYAIGLHRKDKDR